MKRIVIAAPHSGSGKTTLTLGIMDALKRRGLRVAPFKVGPDFIDPGYHRLVTGTTSVNLDGWMCGLDFVRDSFAYNGAGADIAVIEGVMGLFDGIDGISEAGSTAEIAKVLAAPVLLVVDARSQARSAAALVHGFASFDPGVKIAGVIFNNVASANHERILREALGASSPEIALVGCLPREPELAIPSRHLGLMTAEENPLSGAFLQHLGEVVDRHLDLDLILRIAGERVAPIPRHAVKLRARSLPCPPYEIGGKPNAGRQRGDLPGLKTPLSRHASLPPCCTGGTKHHQALNLTAVSLPLPLKGRERLNEGETVQGARFLGTTVQGTTPVPYGADRVRIAVARDAAFCFVYEDNLRLLRERGAELCCFSPLTDAALPDGISGIYLPGGYPELFAEILAANNPLKEAIHRAIESDLPVYAECGGFIYLTQGVTEGEVMHPLVGIFPVNTRMLPRRKALGYREVELLAESVIGGKGTLGRGHEFHYSEMAQMPLDVERLYQVSKKGQALGQEGYRYRNCLASYIHLHFGGSPEIADNFVRHCREYKTRSSF
jgi:cobyrinic acid a,c-diamide synthase